MYMQATAQKTQHTLGTIRQPVIQSIHLLPLLVLSLCAALLLSGCEDDGGSSSSPDASGIWAFSADSTGTHYIELTQSGSYLTGRYFISNPRYTRFFALTGSVSGSTIDFTVPMPGLAGQSLHCTGSFSRNTMNLACVFNNGDRYDVTYHRQ